MILTDLCIDCHFRPHRDGTDKFVANGNFCEREQGETWQRDDKHRRSFELIASGPGLELTQRILGFPLREVLDLGPFADRPDKLKPAAMLRPGIAADDPRRQTVERCLACHAPVEERPDGPASEYFIEYGVSCQACHGPGSQYELRHQAKEWRIVWAEVKEEKFGLRDLRHPVKRAELCASCHVGQFPSPAAQAQAEPARFIKHEWYAKGHPPLPGFEYVTFATQMPSHWQSLQSKLDRSPPIPLLSQKIDPEERKRYFDEFPRSFTNIDATLASSWLEANRGSVSDRPALDMARTKDLLISSLAVLAAYQNLIVLAPPAEARDFALFDCSACHHELRSAHSSKTRVLRGLEPGRPPAFEWPRLLADVAARQNGDLNEVLQPLDLSLSAQPFGTGQSKLHADKLAAAASGLAHQLATQPIDEVAALRILQELTEKASYQERNQTRDYHAARQLAWAVREIAADLAAIPIRPGSNVRDTAGGPAFRKAVADMLSDDPPATREASQNQILRLFVGNPNQSAWHGELRLKLPAGQSESITENLTGSLNAISNYDADGFMRRLQVIHERLAAKPQP